MISLIMDFAAPFLPYIIGAIGVVAAYFGIKAKGRSEARAEVAAENAKTSERMRDATANAPRNRRDAADRLRRDGL